MVNILLVDDEIDFRECVAELIELETGFNVDQAENGLMALEKCQKQHYDLLIVDYRMPKMNGADFFKKLVSENNPNSQSKILFLSGFIEEIKIRVEGDFQINFKGKPISPHDLLNFIKGNEKREAS